MPEISAQSSGTKGEKKKKKSCLLLNRTLVIIAQKILGDKRRKEKG